MNTHIIKESPGVVIVSSPGRINLIGEHTDYNDGFVLPAAIDKRIYMRLTKNGTKTTCRIKSKGFDSVLIADLFSLRPGTEGWHNYVLGVLNELQLLTQGLKGFDCEMYTEVPTGSGVSSSAALECGLAYGLNRLFELGLDKWQLIKLSQRAEHNFVGTKCGIMDQFSSVMGKKKHAMLLDCQSLEFEYIPTKLDPYVILMLNTNVTHNLATSGYNTRREESATGLNIVTNHFGVKNSFREITPGMIEECRQQLGDVRYRRCTYILEENQRVLKAAKALKKNDILELGNLLYSSHKGQSEKYEVSCPELDFLVEFSKGTKEILGSRMVGGGFGGCTLNLIHKDAVVGYVERSSIAYEKKFKIKLSHFVTAPSRGTSITKQRHDGFKFG
ncbi:galactokinase [Flagellimonas sp. 389]|uniref:galactokinase n=1 Tax=Flagellimonas sp. 389 TaxID=2835862 RepID=UPI001BD2A512|nr:galactokinase [Flagellimonas sp. 389]MBS9462900.1 galactokinase [Flagellimonas sp. 389]